LQGACSLLDRFIGATFLFTSSTSVYGQKAGEWVTEKDTAQPDHEEGRVLREAEQIVLGGGGIVARVAGIYGPGRSALLKRFLNGKAVIDPENDRLVNQAHRDDIATALFRLLDQDSGRGQIYNVVDDKPILQSDFYRWLAERLNRPLPPVGSSPAKGKRGKSNKRVSNAKLRALGWAPRYPSFAEGMEKSVLPSFGY
jgi:nucleoside-diphosphate-sugar epimerase